MLLEIAVFNAASAILAAQAGAHRIELCDNEKEGGTTPSYGTLEVVRNKINIPIFPMIRPRGGDFVYTIDEFNIMKKDIQICKQMGFEGVVFGILQPDGSIDTTRTQQLVDTAYPLQVTFHKAFDRTKNPQEAVHQIIQCGCKRILTSGQYTTASEGIPAITNLIKLSNNNIIIMPGGGVRSNNIKTIANQTNAIEFHSSAKKIIVNHSFFSPTTMHDNVENISIDTQEISTMISMLKN